MYVSPRTLPSISLPMHSILYTEIAKSRVLSSLSAFDIRGGAVETFAETATGVAFDLNRTKIRLEGLSSYSVVSVLLMSSALRLYTSVPKKLRSKKDEEYNKVENMVAFIFSIFSILTVVSGTNTAIIFSLINLYSKTALGMEKNAAFIEFFSSTAGMRKFGFQSMVCSLISLELSFTLSVFLYFKGKTRYILSTLSGLISFASFLVWASIVQKASALFL
jgi:hypothetical protein